MLTREWTAKVGVEVVTFSPNGDRFTYGNNAHTSVDVYVQKDGHSAKGPSMQVPARAIRFDVQQAYARPSDLDDDYNY